jgi:hypothetical protein
VTLIVSFLVILLVSALVGRVCAKSRPGEHRVHGDPSWPGVIGGSVGGDLGSTTVHLPDTGHHHSGWSHSHSHSDGGWGGDSGGFGGGDSGGGGGGN